MVLAKNCQVFHPLIQGKIGQENVFHDIVKRFWSKIGNFSTFLC